MSNQKPTAVAEFTETAETAETTETAAEKIPSVFVVLIPGANGADPTAKVYPKKSELNKAMAEGAIPEGSAFFRGKPVAPKVQTIVKF